MPDPTPAVSPTGKPLVPVSWVPVLMAITATAASIAALDPATLAFLPPSALAIVAAVKGPAGLVAFLGLLALGGSPGLRKSAEALHAEAVAAQPVPTPSEAQKALAEMVDAGKGRTP